MHLTNFHFYNPKNYLNSKPVKGLQGCGVGYRFAFNGKERDNETYGEGNAYDFGARIYDSRLGRFLSVDNYRSTFPSQSTYQFAGNCPIRFIDYNGDFKIDPFFVKQYPATAKMIQFYLPLLRLNEDARKAFIQVSNFSPNASKVFDEMVNYGNGPWITPTRPGEAPWGRVESKYSVNSETSEDYPSNVFIDQGMLLNFEKAVQSALNGGNWEEVARQMLVVSFNIMHEAGGHWNFMHHFGGEALRKANDNGHEHGNKFIEYAFGASILKVGSSGLTTNTNKVRGQFYDQNINSFKTIGMTLHSFNIANKIFGKSIPDTKGQKGDPSVTVEDRKKGPYKHKNPRNL